MIALLGASGYVGGAFEKLLRRRGTDFHPVSRADVDCTNFKALRTALKDLKAAFVINAAGFTGKPNVDACEQQRAETILGNIVLPQTVAEACDTLKIGLGTVSSGCIYAGAKIRRAAATWHVAENLNDPALQDPLKDRAPDVRGFDEADDPNFTFRGKRCSFYSGTKGVAEEALAQFPDFYIWRLRIPFNEIDGPRNYISKIQRYSKVYQNWNSISHLDDFADACWQTWRLRLPGGRYNVVNPGYVSTREVVELVRARRRPDWRPEFWANDEAFYAFAKAPRSNCLLDAAKLMKAGVKLRPVMEALADSINRFQPEHAT